MGYSVFLIAKTLSVFQTFLIFFLLLFLTNNVDVCVNFCQWGVKCENQVGVNKNNMVGTILTLSVCHKIMLSSDFIIF